MNLLAKVCGLTTAEDAAFAAGQGADLLGFVFHPPSPRHCADLSVAEAFLDRAVLVMVDERAEALLEKARRHGFRRIQPYLPAVERERGISLLREAGLFVLLPWADEPGQAVVPADLYLWESSPTQTGVAGGSGQSHPMTFPPPGPFLLAGGLDGTNLADRATALPLDIRPHLRGFDAASRLEGSPGVKDPSKVAAFVAAVRHEASAGKGTHD
ncbi:phosphoribosylanthranilate isomerase [Geothrix edaphica]|uniref:N-(5'-phosphoribosyl)anthranilate isomerase n=1 Tax=Geothrix edaphica TaxID=2927976 RepID=A0ABQ5PX29_9BACT|nr:phosphoribosylanthranilate isomerase [Geothrix edaphica]GLH66674.1 N-(5'-phosphoribosyl)anthranilate isomerase [Geothrix edaphica]